MKKRILSLLLTLVMVVSLIPTTVWAAEHDNQVRVIVENTTYSKASGAPWDGTLVDTWVNINEESTMMSCVGDALAKNNIPAEGIDNGYITTINGLSDQGGTQSGWMGTLNDWFPNAGFTAFDVAAGDEIRVMYTCAWGADLGSDWSSTDKTLKALSFSAGTLSSAFHKDTHSYTLTVPADTDSVVVTPTASNKNYQVRTYVGGTEYKRTAAIPVSAGTVITVKCGDPSWPSMSDTSGEAQVYTITVQAAHSEPAATANVTILSQAGGAFLHGIKTVDVSSLEAENFGFTDKVEGGVSALDVLVKAHELRFGTAFTNTTAGDYLAVGDTGFIEKIFDEETGNCGFTINGEQPHDDTLQDDEYAPGGKSYTGYAITEAAVKTGDTVEFFLYQDSYALDNYPLWERNGEPLTGLTVKPGTAVSLTVNGYCIGYYGRVPMDALVNLEQIEALEGAQLAWVSAEDGELTNITNAVVDEAGKVSFTSPAEAGTYYLTAFMPAEEINNDATPVIMSVLPVTVDTNAPDLPEPPQADPCALKELVVKGYAETGYDQVPLALTPEFAADTLTYTSAQRIFRDDFTKNLLVVSLTAEDSNATITATLNGKDEKDFSSQNAQSFNTLIPGQNNVLSITVTNGEKNRTYTVTIPMAADPATLNYAPVTITAPAGSIISVGTLTQHYVYEFVDPVRTDESTGAATYHLDKGTTYFYRVQHPDGVTYWNFGKWSEGTGITVTEEDLHIGDSSFNKNTVYRFDKNVYDLGNVYLNINRQGYLNMDVGESFELNVFRNWQAIESTSNAQIALPDVHYQVIDVNGGASDVLTITPDENNTSLATMTANKAGTAIVLVTYDAMTHMQAMGGSALSAIWPECTGVFIVTVGADGSSLQTNTLMERPGVTVANDEQKYLDAEHDILFYLGSEGASYSFTPEAGCTVTVARSTVGSAMTFNGFTSEGVTVAANGEVTVTGLTTGRHIIKVEKNGLANYQVVTARGVSYDMYDAAGNKLTADTELNPGDTVKLQFHNLVSPKEKMARIYNFNFSLYYLDANGTAFQSDSGGGRWDVGVYNFSSDPDRQMIEITIPENWEGLTYQLTGAIKVGGYGGTLPSHRGASYTQGLSGNQGTSTAAVLCELPTLTLKLKGYAEKSENLADIYKATGDYLAQQGTPAAGSSIGGEWTVIGLARSGRSIPSDSSYYNALVTYVKYKINPTTMRLSGSKSTENSRIILALTALGKDVTNVGGYNLLAGLNEMSYIQKQGTNGPVWALLALDSHDYAPQGDVTREKLINAITGLQMENGAWYISDSNKSADTDMTAMAIQALAPYYKTDSVVKTAVDKALAYLSSIQKADGSFSAANGGSASGESTAQVLAALCALGIDPITDSRFIKSGSTVLDGLCKFYVDGGGFRHDPNGERNTMATEQCYYALAAYHRMKAGQKFLYDMTDVCINGVHSGDWVVTKTASCTEDGAKTRTCTVCGTVETLVLPALGHKAGSETFMNETSHWQVCSVCGAKLNETAHSYIGGQQCVCGYRKDHNRIVVSETVIVPETLKENEKLNTPEKIKAELTSRIAAKNSKFTAKNTVVMDVTLQVLKNGQWQNAKPEDFSATGAITVLLPYPDGIDSSNYRKYDFMVSHMFTTNANGKTPGDVEFPSVIKTADGLLVTLTGLSPVAISYAVRTSSTGGSGSGASQPATDIKSSDTGDSSQMTLWMGGVLLSAAALTVLTRKRKRSAE